MKAHAPSPAVVVILAILSPGCSTGYTEVDGEWAYIVINEAVGREVRKMDVDKATYRILDVPAYAADKTHVWRFGYVLEGVAGDTFEFLDGNDYARDSKHVYYHDRVVHDTDPATLQVLDPPYARDAKRVYCGSLRMNVDNIDSFRVTESVQPGTRCFYSTEELVERFGEKFSNHKVLYDRDTNEWRFAVETTLKGRATDGTWILEGPKRLGRVNE